MNYIFDLDGTLIDSSERMYRFFCELIPECKLSKQEYWDYKRNKVNHKELIEIKYPNHNFDEFNDKWLKRIEDEYYLNMDKNYEDTIYVLDTLKKRGDNLYLLTARQSKENLLNELSRLDLIKYFDLIMVTEGIITKEELLEKNFKTNPKLMNKDNIFVSDMGKDIQLAKKYKYKTIAVSHGFMSKKILLTYGADIIVDSLHELLKHSN